MKKVFPKFLHHTKNLLHKLSLNHLIFFLFDSNEKRKEKNVKKEKNEKKRMLKEKKKKKNEMRKKEKEK